MKKLFTLIILLFCGLSALFVAERAGARDIDSLKLTLQDAKGSRRIDVLNQLSRLSHDQNTRDALFYAREAIKFASNAGDKERLAVAYINAGIVLRNTGQSDKALDYFFNAVNLTETLNAPKIKADALHKISVAYLLIRDFENALEYGQEEILIWEELHDDYGLSKAHNSLGLIYLNLDRLEVAENNLLAAKEIGKKIGEPGLIFKPLLNLGDLAISQKNHGLALQYIEESLAISREYDNTFGLTGGWLKLGEAYSGLQQYEKAIDALQKAKEYAKELQSLSLLRNAYKALGEISEEAGRYKEALDYNRLYISTEDSMIGEITKRKIAQAKARFEISEMEREMERMGKEATYNTFRTAFIFTLIILAGILIGVIINRQQLKKRSSNRLSVTREEAEEKNLALIEQERLLEASEKERQEEALYAQKVQEAVVHTLPTFLNIFPDFFLHNQPRSTGTGDFSWFTHKNDSVVIAIGDCEGMGTMGALNTVVIQSLLTQIVNESQYRTPSDILFELDKKVAPLMQTQASEGTVPKLRIAICNVNINTRRLTYAGAQMPLYLFNNGKLKVIPGGSEAIMGNTNKRQDAQKMNNQAVTLRRRDKFLLLTDGYQRQVGGDQSEPLSEHKLVESLSRCSAYSLADLKTSLVQDFEDWKGQQGQTDDLLVFGMTV